MEQNIIIIIIIIITIMYIDGICISNPLSANTTWSDNKDALASDQMIYCDAVDDDSASNMLYLWPIDGTRCFTNAMFDLLVLSSRPTCESVVAISSLCKKVDYQNTRHNINVINNITLHDCIVIAVHYCLLIISPCRPPSSQIVHQNVTIIAVLHSGLSVKVLHSGLSTI